VAWGLLFLLSSDTQKLLIQRVARVLKPSGKFLFTAPSQPCTWPDAMTGRQSISLGFTAYEEILRAEGLTLMGTEMDEGDNHYYLAQKT
jgi:hypothetical protein